MKSMKLRKDNLTWDNKTVDKIQQPRIHLDIYKMLNKEFIEEASKKVPQS